MPRTQTFSMEVDSDMANLAGIAEFIADAAVKVQLTQKQSDDLQMAVDEAVTNVMEHAYRGRTDGRISILCRSDGKEILIEIRDSGIPFDASKVKTPNVNGPLTERTIGGLGVFFMRKLMDKVEFTRDTKGNVTRLTKKLK